MPHHDSPAQHAGPRLDRRAPFVLDTHELGRRPGSMRRVHRTVPAPRHFGLEMIRVPEGAELVLDLRLEAVMEGVLVTGTAHAPLTGECGRCLEPVTGVVDAELQELFAYTEEDADEDTSLMNGDLLDLEATVHDAVVLALPLTPLCAEDCPGLCVTCGVRLADAGPDHAHEDVDPRWGALRTLYPDQTTQER